MAFRLRFFAFLSLLLTCANAWAADELLAEFSPSKFDGWTYVNQGDIDLNNTNIARGRITLLTTEQGNLTSLTSPQVTCSGADMLRIEVLYASDNDTYIADRLTLHIELVAPNGNIYKQSDVRAKAQMLEQTLTAVMAVNRNMTPRIRFTAPRADKENCAAVKRVRIYGIKRPSGDINGDGDIDVTDVSLLIDAVLGKTELALELADINGDKMLDVTDVSALIDIVLGK